MKDSSWPDSGPAEPGSVVDPSMSMSAPTHETAPSAAEQAAFGRQLRHGLGWSFLNNVVARVGILVSGIIVARLIEPRDAGIYSVALLAMTLLMSLNDLGLSAALIRAEDPDALAPTVATLITTFSVGLFGLFYALAPLFTRVMNAPGATGVVRLMAFGLVIDGLFTVPAVLLTRSFRQGQRALADTAGFVVSTAITLVMAADGHGAWSLAVGRIFGNLTVGLAVYVFAGARLRFGFDRQQAGEILRFGLPLAGSGLLTFAVLNVDYVIVSRVLGQVSLGYYTYAFNFSSWPVNTFVQAVRRVSLAGFSRLRDEPSSMREAYVRSIGLLTAITVPVCVMFAVFGPQAVRFVYGEKWSPAGEVLRYLALLGLVRVILELSWDYFVALGRSRICFLIQAWWLVVLIPCLIVGAKIGDLRGMGVGHCVAGFALVLPALLRSLRSASVSLRRFAVLLARPLIGGALAAGAGLVVLHTVDGDFMQLLVGGAAGTALHGLLVWPMRRLAKAPLSDDRVGGMDEVVKTPADDRVAAGTAE